MFRGKFCLSSLSYAFGALEILFLSIPTRHIDSQVFSADIFAELLNTKGENTFIIPGGKTPLLFYQYLAQRVENWRDTTLVLSDERLVQEDAPEPNYGMIKKNLLDFIQREIPSRLVPIVNGFEPENTNQILKSLNSSTRPLLPPKAAFLGIGTDGHTASLFPGFEESFYNDEAFILINRPSEPFQRISVSLKILSETPLLVFLVAGKEKKTVIRQIVNESEDRVQLPVQSVIRNTKGMVTILCDREAYPG